jgi:conjugative relaxase-like TrwC/TraI family protein
MPKSASVLAYVAGDERLLTAHMQAVRQTMGWVEKTFAEGRTYVDNPKGDPIRTGHLTYALFSTTRAASSTRRRISTWSLPI